MIENLLEFIDLLSDENVPPMPLLKGDEELKQGTRIKILNPKKLLTRLPVLLAQLKAGNNSFKLENEIMR